MVPASHFRNQAKAAIPMQPERGPLYPGTIFTSIFGATAR